MAKVVAKVWQFKSSSNPNKAYETLQFTDGSTSCNCPGWTRRVDAQGNRSCKHTRSVDMGTAKQEADSHHNYQTVEKKKAAVKKLEETAVSTALSRKIVWK